MRLFKFPKDLKVQQNWIQFVTNARKLNQKNNAIYCNQSQYICCAHFFRVHFANFPKFRAGFSKRLLLKQNACPSVQFDSNGTSIDAVMIEDNQESIAVLVSLDTFFISDLQTLNLKLHIKKFAVPYYFALHFYHVC